jgi:hypothetical protein
VGLFDSDGQPTPLAELAAELNVDYWELREWLAAEIAARRGQVVTAGDVSEAPPVPLAPR